MRLAFCAMCPRPLTSIDATEDVIQACDRPSQYKNPESRSQDHVQMDLRQDTVECFPVQPSISLNESCRGQHREETHHSNEHEPILEVCQKDTEEGFSRYPGKDEVNRPKRDRARKPEDSHVGMRNHPV